MSHLPTFSTETPVAPPSRHKRVAAALGVALLTALYVWWFGYTTHQLAAGGSDFDQLWAAARAFVAGREPYDAVGPGREYSWAWPLLYPMPAVLTITPFTILPVVAARVLFSALSAGALAFALSRDGFHRFPILASAAMMDAARGGQLAPLLTAALLLPSIFWLIALKPNLGAAFGAATSSRRALLVAAAGSALLLTASFLTNPDWLGRWLAALPAAKHLRIPVATMGGPLLLLALTRWRRLDARILLACACVPHTPVVYDVVPLGLVARTFRESLAFALLTFVALFAQDYFVTGSPPAESATLAARILNLTVYLPCLVAVLLRPNEGVPPAWLTYLSSWRAAVRQRVRA